jgi:multidrug efflux system membrane fusion protein
MEYRKVLMLCQIGLMVGFFLNSCGEKKESKEIIRPVRYQQVFATGGNRLRIFAGVAQAGVESDLSFRVGGTVERIKVEVGDEINAGQLIGELDPTDYQLHVQQAEAALVQAKAKARNADAAYSRAIKLYENRNIAKSNLDAARAASESADAAVSSMEKQLELARRQLKYTKLIAPLSGSIAQVACEINENVQAGQSIVTLTSGSQVEVKISIPEILISQIREGLKVSVNFDALPNKEFTAIVTEVGVTTTGMGTTFPVTVRLDRTDPNIRPGMAATVSFLFESKDERERFIVPSHAVVEDRNGRFVYVVVPTTGETGQGTIHRKSVTVGNITAEGLEIFEGLSDGDLVVTAGVSRITEGQKVKL